MAIREAPEKIFKSLGDSVRIRIFELLMSSSLPLTMNEVADRFDISRQAVARHLMVLRESGLVDLIKRGRERYCHPNPRPLLKAEAWMLRFTGDRTGTAGRTSSTRQD